MSASDRTYDVAIIGGGVIGSSIAYWLAREQNCSIIVVERDPTYATASSALSASSIRQQFSTPTCIAMSQFGFRFLREIADYLSVDDTVPDVGLTERGYLYLADRNGESALRANHEIQRAHGVPVEILLPGALSGRFDWLNATDIAAGSLGLSGEGWFDGYTLLQAFKSKARQLGVVYRNDEVIGLERADRRIEALSLASGERICAGEFVNAAGPHAGTISRWAGIRSPIVPERRTVFVFACREAPQDCPLVIDPSGVYFRHEGQYFISGGPAAAHARDGLDLSPDFEQFDELIWPTLAHRVPAFESIKMIRAWAGHYEMNLFDHNALIGRWPGCDNYLIAAGFSGHGMQHAPAAGRGIAELMLRNSYHSLDLSPLSPERLLARRPISEGIII